MSVVRRISILFDLFFWIIGLRMREKKNYANPWVYKFDSFDPLIYLTTDIHLTWILKIISGQRTEILAVEVIVAVRCPSEL